MKGKMHYAKGYGAKMKGTKAKSKKMMYGGASKSKMVSKRPYTPR